MTWNQPYQVNVHDTDFNRVVSAGGIMRYMQDTANLQMEGESPSYLDLFERGYVFVISRFRLCVYEPVRWHQMLLSSTWAIPSSGYSYLRGYRLTCEGRTVAEADSVWALLELKTGRPVKTGSLEFGYDEDEPLTLPLPPRVHLPSGLVWESERKHRVLYSETDMNGHMNNTIYPDMFCHDLPMEGKRVSSFCISYLTEAPMDEMLTVRLGRQGEEWFGQSVRSDGKINADVRITLCDL